MCACKITAFKQTLSQGGCFLTEYFMPCYQKAKRTKQNKPLNTIGRRFKVYE